MKLSVSLPEEDVGFVDEYVKHTGSSSRSAAIHDAIALLRSASLEDAYLVAWQEWESDGEAEVWEIAVGDGVVDAQG
ncbi:ribbon-helix-helix domain-containing protein [Kutzneria sp. NPDC051319]|uniref:ribbon-helix-helix domain-containing protein n=1 Tax=Kutzneria sp. NPDC051319 TaxID=3155047 RepID=UPI0034176980